MDKDNGMRTPLRRVRGLGAAREGTGHFWAMRLTSVALLPLTLFAIGLLIALNGASYDETRETLANPFVGLMLMAMIGGSLYHMWLGMQDIILDYFHGDFGKYSLLMLNTFFSIAVGAACAFSLLKIAFGG